MTDRPTFDPFAVLAAARSKSPAPDGCETFAALSQEPKTAINEEIEWVSSNFRNFAAFAGASDPRAASPSSLYLERKKDFSLSLQEVSHDEAPPLADRDRPGLSERAPTSAEAAKLRSNALSACNITENPRIAAAKVSQGPVRETGSEAIAGCVAAKDPETSDAALAGFEERAAFLEYECGLSRAEAETQAQAETANAPGRNARPGPVADTLAGWYVAFARLNPERPPCPGYRFGEWTGVYSRALAFLDTFGEQAEALGWTASRLFGVHETAGIVRVDACGALVLPVSGPVRAITATEVRFGHLTHRQKPGQPAGVPWWEWRR